jgi:hypothetical protein
MQPIHATHRRLDGCATSGLVHLDSRLNASADFNAIDDRHENMCPLN